MRNTGNASAVEWKLTVGKPEDKSIFRNLMQMYQHDLSEFSGESVDCHGVFEYPYLGHYWTPEGREMEGRIPLLVYCNNELGGFVLITSRSYEFGKVMPK
jgi:hypothetical protein